jgi:hypothetical protein
MIDPNGWTGPWTFPYRPRLAFERRAVSLEAGGSILAWVAQLVEQRTENPRVGGSNPPPGTIPLRTPSRTPLQIASTLHRSIYSPSRGMPHVAASGR